MDSIRIASRCVTLVENLLREERQTFRWLEEHDKNTSLSKFKIARLEYALGERETLPSVKEFKKEAGIV